MIRAIKLGVGHCDRQVQRLTRTSSSVISVTLRLVAVGLRLPVNGRLAEILSCVAFNNKIVLFIYQLLLIRAYTRQEPGTVSNRLCFRTKTSVMVDSLPASDATKQSVVFVLSFFRFDCLLLTLWRQIICRGATPPFFDWGDCLRRPHCIGAYIKIMHATQEPHGVN